MYGSVDLCDEYSDFDGFLLEECVLDAYLTRHYGWELIVVQCNDSSCAGTIHCIGLMILYNKDEFKCVYIYSTCDSLYIFRVTGLFIMCAF